MSMEIFSLIDVTEGAIILRGEKSMFSLSVPKE